MAKKRKSESMKVQAGTCTEPAAHRNANPQHFKQDLQNLCEVARINIPDNEVSSPVKSQEHLGTHVFKLYHLLWWKNQVALEAALNDYYHELSKDRVTTTQSRLELLQKYLKGPADETKTICATPRKTLKTSLPSTASLPLSEPSSPTLGIKRHFTTSKSGLSSDRSFKRGPSKPSVIPDAVTSFASTTANTSFANTSFWSNAESTGTPNTAATSFSSDLQGPPKRDTDYLSSLCSADAAELRAVAQVESSRSSSSNDKTVRALFTPTLNAPVSSRISQSTWYGSIDADQARFLEQACLNDADHHKASTRKMEVDIASDLKASSAFVDVPQRKAPTSSTRQRSPPSHTAHISCSHTMQPSAQTCASPESTSVSRFFPAQNFAQLKLPESYSRLPFHVQWEAQRLLQTGQITHHELQEQWTSRSLDQLYSIAANHQKPLWRGFKTGDSSDFEGRTLNAKLEFAKASTGTLFDLHLQGPKKDTSSDLQRRFGADRVLYVNMPNLNKPPDTMKGRNLLMRFREMAETPQTFLGRRWFLFLLQPHKKKKLSDLEGTNVGANRLVFVAIDDNLTVADVMAYVVPYEDNASQAARKMYTRLELVTSSTIPIIVFESKDIDYGVEDKLATTHDSDRTFLDPALSNKFYEPQVSFREMSDGCNEMSSYTAFQISKALGNTMISSAAQARIAGSKGVWYRAPNANIPLMEQKPHGPHIKLAKTQIKVKRRSLSGCHPGTRTLNLVKCNSHAKPSILHIGFLPILLDRGVPQEDILDVVRAQVRNDMNELETALKSPSPLPLRRWLHARNESWEDRNRDGGIKTMAGFPQIREERIVQMLEAGFLPIQDAYLASEERTVVKTILDTSRKNFKIHLSRSTTLMGMSDPLSCLEPGEIHVHFGAPFRDSTTGVSWPLLTNMEGLVARNPAMAPWDIQKIRFVFKPELAHLPDMAIFSVKGKQPLAGMLQGGDYDGDTFWLCWEPKLVEPFKNAPPPWEPPLPEDFGITKDKKTLRDYIRDPRSESQWCKWLGDMAVVRTRFNFLGTATKLHERLVYLQGRVDSPQAIALVQLHDCLVDADKQGYDFDSAAFEHFKKMIQLPEDLPLPLHWKFTKRDDDDEGTYPVHGFNITGNIIDEVYLRVITPMANATISRVDNILSVADHATDPDLAKFYNETWDSSAKDSIVRKELKILGQGLEDIRRIWTTEQRKWTLKDLILQLRTRYDLLMPQDTKDPTVVEWLRRQGDDLTLWEKLKASAFAKFHHGTNKKGRLVFHVAGRELCILKAHESGGTRTITELAYNGLRPRKIKTIEVLPDDEDDGNDIVDDGEEVEKDMGYY